MDHELLRRGWMLWHKSADLSGNGQRGMWSLSGWYWYTTAQACRIDGIEVAA